MKPDARRHWRGPIIVFGVALIARIVVHLSLPVVITNDGVGYITRGAQITAGAWPDFPPTRTPGYPVFLGGAFALLGENTDAIGLAQHALGVGSALLAWLIGGRLGGRRVGIAGGVLVAIDPWLLGFERYALSESLSVSLVLAACAAALHARPGRLALPAVLAGFTIGLAVLTRPAMQAWAPMLLVACALPSGSARRSVQPILAFVLALGVTLGPWLAWNTNRGVPGLVRTEGLALWGGLARSGRLDPAFDVPEPLRERADTILASDLPPEEDVMGFYNAAGRTEGIDRANFLRSWSRASVRADPAGYARAVGHAALWQCNAMLPGTPYRHDSMRWMMSRLGRDGRDDGQAAANLQVSSEKPKLPAFHAPPGRGPIARLYERWPVGMMQCAPHLPAGATAAIACGVLVRRRRFAPAAILLGSFAVVAGHALLLQPFARYSMSAWALWWCAAPMLVFLKDSRVGTNSDQARDRDERPAAG